MGGIDSASADVRSERVREAGAGTGKRAERTLGVLGRLGLAGQTGFYAVLTALAARIAALGGRANGKQANANGALAAVCQSWLGEAAVAAVALGFVLFGVARVVGAWREEQERTRRRVLGALQGLFFVALATAPASFLAGRHQTGSQQSQVRVTAQVLSVPGGRVLLVLAGLAVLALCAVTIRMALHRDFRNGLDLQWIPRALRRVTDAAGAVGITARAVAFGPIGIFLMVAAVTANPRRSYGTDALLLHLSGHAWGMAVIAVVAAGLATSVVYSAIETRYRRVVSAR